MQKIRIIEIPPGTIAPESIRAQWVGVVMPLANPIKNGTRLGGNENGDGYQVKGIDAIKALSDAGKHEACDFWKLYSFANFIFKIEVCELID